MQIYRLYGFHIFGAIIYTGIYGGDYLSPTWSGSPLFKRVVEGTRNNLNFTMENMKASFRCATGPYLTG